MKFDILGRFLMREERGSALVEFAVTVPLLTLLFFGSIQAMFAMYVYHYTAWAAQQGARYATVRGYTWSQNTTTACSSSLIYNCTASAANIQSYMQSLGAINSTKLTMNTSTAYVWPGTNASGATTGCTTNANSPGCLVKVTANYSFNFVPFLPFTGLTMSATSQKTILQ
jgi:Flp pilus assembly protein TadG